MVARCCYSLPSFSFSSSPGPSMCPQGKGPPDRAPAQLRLRSLSLELCAQVKAPAFDLLNLVLPQVGPSPWKAPSPPTLLIDLPFSSKVLHMWGWPGEGGFLPLADQRRSLSHAISVPVACLPCTQHSIFSLVSTPPQVVSPVMAGTMPCSCLTIS